MTDTPFHRIAELLDEQYPDPAPPKEYVIDFMLYQTLSEDELEHLRRELTADVEVEP